MSVIGNAWRMTTDIEKAARAYIEALDEKRRPFDNIEAANARSDAAKVAQLVFEASMYEWVRNRVKPRANPIGTPDALELYRALGLGESFRKIEDAKKIIDWFNERTER